ncbi:MAG: hypothetical protein ACXADH_02405 [Candidatus Kariarchaeaceae archaeon]|jgi:predicted nucleotidyltransferase
MSEIPLEYKVMKKKFFKAIQKELGDDLVGIIVYGGAASERVFSGISDIDFCIIIKKLSELSRPLSDVYVALSKEILTFLEDPLFSSILDYDIYVEDQLPQDNNLRGFSPIRAHALSTGELLVGLNPFEGLQISDEDLKNGARRMVQEYLEKVSSLMFVPSFEEDEALEGEIPSMDAEKNFLALDAILSSAQAYHIVKQKKYVNMPDVVLFAETEPVEGLDNDLVRNAGLLRQGVETDTTDFFIKSFDFCGSVISLLNNL